MMDYKILVLILLIILLIIIIISAISKRRNNNDNVFYNLNNDTAYRNGIYRQISVDFKPYIQQLYQSIDRLNSQIKRTTSEISQTQYDAMIDIYKTADKLNSQIDSYWNSQKFNKDFSYYIGLHYASHLLANSLKNEQQHIKEAFIECKRRQQILSNQIEAAQKRQDKVRGEQRYRISKEIGDLCKHHKNISTWKSCIGSLNTKYNQRVTNQNIKTAQYRDYIASNFGARGQNWKKRCHQRAITRKMNN